MDKCNLSTYQYVSTNSRTLQNTPQYWNRNTGSVEVKNLSRRQFTKIFASYVYISEFQNLYNGSVLCAAIGTLFSTYGCNNLCLWNTRACLLTRINEMNTGFLKLSAAEEAMQGAFYRVAMQEAVANNQAWH